MTIKPNQMGPLGILGLAIFVVSLAGCGLMEVYTEVDDGEGRPYRVVGNKRYVSGPYGSITDVHGTIEAVKRHSASTIVSARAVKLPNHPSYALIKIFDYQFPAHCGSHSFRVLEGENLQILEYRHAGSTDIAIVRDYVVGPSPFIEAGLWTPYDHTADSVAGMRQLSGRGSEDGLGLMTASYDIGLVTTLAKSVQLELGRGYGKAVHAASGCLQVATR